MISFKLDTIGQVHILFKGQNFLDILNLCKSSYLRYEPKTSSWISSPSKALSLLPKFENIESVDVNIEQLKEATNRSVETQFIRFQFDESVLSYPPIKGKTPFENFQIECMKKGLNQNRLALFLGMGLGKTYIMIGILNHLFKYKNISNVLIISPVEGLYNWKTELLRFNSFNLTEEEIYIANAKNRLPFNEVKNKIVIMSYRTFLMISDDEYSKTNKGKRGVKYRKPILDFTNFGQDENNRVIILDESHLIKNKDARQTHVISLHKQFFHYRYLLTGTPTPNSFNEIYTQMKFLDEASVPDAYMDFVLEIANVGNRFSMFAINYFYEDKIKNYEKKFSPWVIRIKSDEAIDLPELYVKKIHLELPSLQKQIYQQLIDYVLLVIKEDNDGRIIPRLVQNKFPYISQALDNPLLLNRDDSIKSSEIIKLLKKFKFKDHGKLEITNSIVEQLMNDKKKLVIYDYHPLTLDLLAEHYLQYDPLVIHGQNTPSGISTPEFRSNIIEEFKHSNKRNLLIASSIVLSTAVNIVQCHNVIYFSRNWNLIDWVQSQKRFHRIGQTQNVLIQPMIFIDSLDERLDGSLDKKKHLNDSIFQKESLTKDEWKGIFTGKM